MGCPLGFNASDPAVVPAPHDAALALPSARPLPYAALDPDAVLNFVHIPKTGGSSLEKCLSVWCARNRVRPPFAACQSRWLSAMPRNRSAARLLSLSGSAAAAALAPA